MDPKELIDKAFAEASRNAKATKSAERTEKRSKADIKRVETVNSAVKGHLTGLLADFEQANSLDKFRQELSKTNVDFEAVEKQVRKIRKSLEIIHSISREYLVKMRYADSPHKTNALRREYYGRLVSVVKKLEYGELILYLRGLRKLPSVKKMPTIIIAGYPNVGKSQILKQLSGSEVETQPYPFTTKGILVGYMMKGYEEIQLVDTPGILDRPHEKMNQIEEKAMLALKYLSKDVVFVIDPSEQCGYTVGQQLQLMENIKGKFGARVMVAATHKDVAHKDVESDILINALDAGDIPRLKEMMLDRFYGWKRPARNK